MSAAQQKIKEIRSRIENLGRLADNPTEQQSGDTTLQPDRMAPEEVQAGAAQEYQGPQIARLSPRRYLEEISFMVGGFAILDGAAYFVARKVGLALPLVAFCVFSLASIYLVVFGIRARQCNNFAALLEVAQMATAFVVAIALLLGVMLFLGE